jgi:hypothetical protein
MPAPFCTRCNTFAVNRSHRRLLEYPVCALGFIPVRCALCAKRFYTKAKSR